jgi:Activator of Hsp90 ATPase homolog 1-like protein
MSEIHIVRDYPHPPAKVWRAVTDPALVPLWTVTGAGGRPDGFAPVAGTKFRLLAKPKPGWNGVVDCEVLEVNEPSLLRYSWTGVGGVFMAKLLGHVRRKMLRVGLPPVLDDLDEDGTLRPGSTLNPHPLG